MEIFTLVGLPIMSILLIVIFWLKIYPLLTFYIDRKYPPATPSKENSQIEALKTEIEALKKKINQVNKIASAASLAVGIKEKNEE